MAAYNKYYPEGWKNNEDGDTPIVAAALNHMEGGIVGAVQKSGDTMTGVLRSASDLDYDTAPATSATSEVLQGLDADSHVRFRIYQGVNTNGSKYLYLMARDDDGTGSMSDYNQLGIGLSADGEPVYSLGSSSGSAVNAFRRTLGLGTNGSLPIQISQGGTGITSNPSMLVNLGSTSVANVLQASPRPGVTGTLPVTRGGTGLTASPSILVNLGSASAANVMQASPRPGVTGTLPIANGGTGANNEISAHQSLHVAPWLMFSNSSRANICETLVNNIAINESTVIAMDGASWKNLTSDTTAGRYIGTVNHLDSTSFVFFVSGPTIIYRFTLNVSGTSFSSISNKYRIAMENWT